mmetsp:Transcript_58686/g.162279  ORF Transcript_58686/g.162279 Transcript_58686/m.162279 type:complete len:207 (-) Transcript_58686:59-679(-)
MPAAYPACRVPTRDVSRPCLPCTSCPVAARECLSGKLRAGRGPCRCSLGAASCEASGPDTHGLEGGFLEPARGVNDLCVTCERTEGAEQDELLSVISCVTLPLFFSTSVAAAAANLFSRRGGSGGWQGAPLPGGPGDVSAAARPHEVGRRPLAENRSSRGGRPRALHGAASSVPPRWPHARLEGGWACHSVARVRPGPGAGGTRVA